MRAYRPEVHELDLDFVLHEGGLASTWAQAAAVGDPVAVAGPPGAVAFPQHHAHYVLAVDATALPAAARWLEEAPADVRAHLVIDSTERGYPLAVRGGVEVIWLDRGGLAETVQSLELPEDTFVFAAGEADAVKPLARVEPRPVRRTRHGLLEEWRDRSR
ncbi:siderophore-interacting protein [Aeromicrobium sp. UC242_57]|uniref:siderophore-interacting protein n=1 Tax=Aeromicrobium sp. UC242_57 TaxID=3374624 RepID=UPI00379DABF4